MRTLLISNYMALNILISQPNLYDQKVFMPLVFLCLKTYVDNREDILPVNWLDPLFRNTDVDTMLKDVDPSAIDVLGISCYDWNWNLNIEIAQRIRAVNPNCKIIAGGPHPDWKDPAFFLKYPFIDAVVYQDGEIPFAEIIKAVQQGTPFNSINNLILPTGKTPPGPSFNEFKLSPWLENKQWVLDFKEKYITNGPNQQFTLLWETDRGCPFKCSFCDWGSATNSKVRRYPMERIQEEIDFFTEELGVDVLYHVGANLGIFPRDEEFVEYICRKKEETGFPKSFQYSTSKNTPERTVSIAKMLYNAKLLKKHVVSLQHTVQDVLDCIDRENIPVKRQIPMIRDLNQSKMPAISQMIMGMPGDGYELWIKALTDTLEWGIHYECRIYDFQLLPNSPAAQPEYINKWDIETRVRYHFINGYHKFLDQDHHTQPTTSEFIVKTKTYTLEDWLQMKIFGKMFMAYHGGNITKWVSMYCRNTLGVSYFDFYKDLYENFFKNTALYREGYAHFKHFIDNDDSTDEIQIDHLNNNRYYQLEEYFLWNSMYNSNYSLNLDFWEELRNYLRMTYLDEVIDELLDFNMDMLFTLDYDCNKGKDIACYRDWFSYIDHCTWNCVDNTVDDYNIKDNLLPAPEKFVEPITWHTKDRKLGMYPMGPFQNADWCNIKDDKEKKDYFSSSILAPTYMRGTRTVFNRGDYV
jgi:putative methyltransferase